MNFADRMLEMKDEPYTPTKLTFNVSQEELDELEKFWKDCDRREYEAQKEAGDLGPLGDLGKPYHGAIGGSFSYVITPTSIGHIIIGRYEGRYIKEEKNVTNFGAF